MHAEQRAPISRDSFAPRPDVWQPVVILAPDRREEPLVPSGDERYVVVEEMVDGVAVLEVSQWPRLDLDGRLHFEGEPWSLVGPVDDLQAVFDRARSEHAQFGADRPLRVGDVFMVAGLEEGATSFDGVSSIVDVSATARSAAKAALYGAVASAVTEEYAEDMAVEGPTRSPTEAGYFDVRQRMPDSKGPSGEAQS